MFNIVYIDKRIRLSLPKIDIVELLKYIVILAWVYWALYAVIAPVTVWDAQVYNLARISLADLGGLFGNRYWNTPTQICYPWTFDAIHLIFLKIGFGYDMPSFACFTGLLLIVWKIIATEYNAKLAWKCVGGIMAMPLFVFQAATVKNDMVIVFCIAAWYYAYRLFSLKNDRKYLFLMAVALGLCCGSKSSGVPIAFLAFLFTLFAIRKNVKHAINYILYMIIMFILLGSIEIYINNYIRYNHFLGDLALIYGHSNHDGLCGALANFIRYLFGGFSFGFYLAAPYTQLTYFFERLSLYCLNSLHLADKGCSVPRFNDSTLHFIKDGGEGSSDFGPIGGLSIWFSLYYIITRLKIRNHVWYLSVLSLGCLFLVAATATYLPWNNRFLLVAYCLSMIAFLIESQKLAKIESAYLIPLIIAFYIIANPFFSQNKNPKSFVPAIKNRAEFKLLENPGYIDVYRDISARVVNENISKLVIYAGSDAWILPFFSLKQVSLVPEPDPAMLIETLRNSKAKYLLALNRNIPQTIKINLIQVKVYNEQGDMGVTSLYRLK